MVGRMGAVRVGLSMGKFTAAAYASAWGALVDGQRLMAPRALAVGIG